MWSDIKIIRSMLIFNTSEYTGSIKVLHARTNLYNSWNWIRKNNKFCKNLLKQCEIEECFPSALNSYTIPFKHIRVCSNQSNSISPCTVIVYILARLNFGDSPVLDELVCFYFHCAEFTPIDLCTKETYWRVFILAFVKFWVKRSKMSTFTVVNTAMETMENAVMGYENR